MRPGLGWAGAALVCQELGARPAGHGGRPRRPTPAPLAWPDNLDSGMSGSSPALAGLPPPPGSLPACSDSEPWTPWLLGDPGVLHSVLGGAGLPTGWAACSVVPPYTQSWGRLGQRIQIRTTAPRILCVGREAKPGPRTGQEQCRPLKAPASGMWTERRRGLEGPGVFLQEVLCGCPGPGRRPGLTWLLSGPQPSTPAPWAMAAANTTVSSSR